MGFQLNIKRIPFALNSIDFFSILFHNDFAVICKRLSLDIEIYQNYLFILSGINQWYRIAH